MIGVIYIAVVVVGILVVGVVGYLIAPPLSRRSRIIFASLFTALITVALFELVGAMGHGLNSTMSCEHNLQQLYSRIEDSVSANGLLPIDDQGGLLVEDISLQEGARFQLHSCCDGDIASCYLLGRDVEADDIGGANDAVPKILLYDRPGNHIRRLANGRKQRVDWIPQEDALLLLCNGSIFHWRGDSPAYREWVERYSQGIGEPFPPGMRAQMREGHMSSAD